MDPLSPSELRSYWRDGFLLPIGVFDKAEAQEWENFHTVLRAVSQAEAFAAVATEEISNLR